MSTRQEFAGLLLVVGSFDERGGLQKRYRRFAAAFSELAPVHVLTWRGLAAPRVENRGRGVTVIGLPSLVPLTHDHPALVARPNAVVTLLGGVSAALLARRRWSAVLASGLAPEGVVAGLAARALGRPYFIDTWAPGPLGNVGRLEDLPMTAAWKRILWGASAVFAGTPEIADELSAAGCPQDRIKQLQTGVELDLHAPATPAERARARRALGLGDSRHAVYCGRFDLRHKRLDLLLEAWRRAGLDGWRLLLVGDGPDRARVEALAQRIRPQPRVFGWHDDVRPFLAASDLFVLPTEFESDAASVKEGLASGLAGLVSATGMYARQPPDGVVLVANEADAWAAALKQVAADDASRERLGRAGRVWVERFRDAGETHGAYAEVLGLTGAGR
jgi:glycosyltransferase involved in cell wall biosynthesis